MFPYIGRPILFSYGGALRAASLLIRFSLYCELGSAESAIEFGAITYGRSIIV